MRKPRRKQAECDADFKGTLTEEQWAVARTELVHAIIDAIQSRKEVVMEGVNEEMLDKLQEMTLCRKLALSRWR
jgi:hypothetical protein